MKNLNILGKKVRIKEAELLNHGVMAQYSSVDKIIYIDRTLKGSEYVSTLMHEIGHAICDIYGFRQANFSIDLEELIVESFSTVYCDLMENIEINGESTRKKKTKKRKR